MATQTTVESETSTGLDANLAGALTYVLGLLTGIAFFVLEGDNRFVKFHAAQSIVYSLVAGVIWFGISALEFVVEAIPFVGGLLGGLYFLVTLPVALAFLAGWLYLMYQAYQGVEYELPVLGGVARSLAS
jgi:uncharacterized membrane protein